MSRIDAAGPAPWWKSPQAAARDTGRPWWESPQAAAHRAELERARESDLQKIDVGYLLKDKSHAG